MRPTGWSNHLFLATILLSYLRLINAAYPSGFYNSTGCLYSFVNVDSGKSSYHITFAEAEAQHGLLQKVQYDAAKTNCTKEVFPGNLVMSFQTNDNNMESIELEFRIRSSPSEGFWEIDKAVMQISPSNPDLFKDKTIEMKPVDLYAGLHYSFSCQSLVLQNLIQTKETPHFKITLHQFQVQPFPELERTVFAPSYDCSVWLTLPLIMGFILILFIVFTVLMGVSLLVDQGNQTSDLRFSKQGGMLMNQAQLDATKG